MSVPQGDVGEKDSSKKPAPKPLETNGSSSHEARPLNGSAERSFSEPRLGGGDRGGDRPQVAAMEVPVDNNIERAMKVLKRKLIKEGLFKELKSRRYYEKPCERRKRKLKESIKKARKEELRQKRNSMLIA